MINLINKLLSIFQLKLVSTKPVNMVEETVKYLNTIPKDALRDVDMVEETVKFLNTIPKSALGDVGMTGYVGDVVYFQEMVKGEFPQVSGKTYFRHQVLGKEDTYFDYDGNTYTAEELQEKLNEN